MRDTNAVIPVHRNVFGELLAESRRQPHVECCGLLAGRDGAISVILKARNALASAVAFEIAPEELFELFRRMRAERLEHLGIYHSHPRGENTPSPRDLERAFYPAAAYFILSPQPDALRPVRAFRVREGSASELSLELV